MNFFYLWEGKMLYLGDPLPLHPHVNHSLEISLALETPFQVDIDGIQKDVWCILIGTDEDHRCTAPSSGRLVHIRIDPESEIAKNIQSKHLSSRKIAFPDSYGFQEKFRKFESISDLDELVNQFLERLGSGISVRNMDSRIQKAVSLIKKSEDPGLSLKKIAAEVGLSSGRFVHLFKQETGIPLRRYILWNRLNRALYQISQSDNLTEAAHHAGFSDSAHFSRTFLRMFGIPPSEILKNSQIIQA